MSLQIVPKSKVDQFRALQGRATGFVISNAWDAGVRASGQAMHDQDRWLGALRNGAIYRIEPVR